MIVYSQKGRYGARMGQELLDFLTFEEILSVWLEFKKMQKCW